MGCFSFRSSRSSSKMQNFPPKDHLPSKEVTQQLETTKEEVFMRIPGCKVHLMDEGEALELANGEFVLERILEEDVTLATIIKVDADLQWPLTKDEPVVKLDHFHYLFSLPMKDGDPISYGVTFGDEYGGSLGMLDSFLKENCCFCSPPSPPPTTRKNRNVDWKEYAPKIEDYNNVLAKAIANGTGKIVKGIFICSNAYSNKVQKGGEMVLSSAAEDQYGVKASQSNRKQNSDTRKGKINKSLKRVRKLTKMTEKLSKTMLSGVGIAAGTVMTPVLNSQPGKMFFSMVPGQVVLASLDAVNKVLDAAEVAQKQVLSATSESAAGMVTRRFGESAGEATQDALATAGHCAGTAWNIFKIRKAITPSSSMASGALKNAAKNRGRL